MIRVEIKPELLSWARERAGFDPGALAHRFSEARRVGTRHGAAYAQTDRKVLQRDVDQYRAYIDREIDRLVYTLYELTDDEIATVEDDTK